MSEADEVVRPFPSAKAAINAFGLVTQRPSAFLRAAGGWVAIQIVTWLGSFFSLIALLQSDEALALRFAALPPSAQDWTLAAFPALVTFVAAGAIAVTWHRFVILGEEPGGVLPFHGAQTARYLGRVLLLFGIVFVFIVLFVPLLLMVAGPLARHPALSGVLQLVPLGIAILTMFVLLRTGLAFPAAAVDDRNWSLERSWHQTEGNGWRLFGGMLLVSLPFYALNLALSLIGETAAMQQDVTMLHLATCMSYVVTAVGVAVAAGYYSSAFVFFVTPAAKDRPPASHFS
ncbi:MAG: hypothetical protein SGI91_17315 [Alphaproteobacteria bacterium]|nr:hypothetical protein [Alphaproteobacteria bacterium]